MSFMGSLFILGLYALVLKNDHSLESVSTQEAKINRPRNQKRTKLRLNKVTAW